MSFFSNLKNSLLLHTPDIVLGRPSLANPSSKADVSAASPGENDNDSSSDSSEDSDSSEEDQPRRKLGKGRSDASKSKEKKKIQKPAKREREDEDDNKNEDQTLRVSAPKPKPKPSGGRRNDLAEDPGAYEKEVVEEATAEDRDFLDMQDEDEDVIAEYAAEQNFDDDEAPMGGSRKKPSSKKRRMRIDGEVVETEDLGPKEKRAKGGGRHKEMTDEEKRTIVRKLLRKMRDAARDDFINRKEGKPALNKLQLLPEVRLTIANAALHLLLLEGTAIGIHGGEDEDGEGGDGSGGTLLSALREWLRPLPGADMPNPQLRTEVYKMLGSLPIGIEHLRESKIGHVLAFFANQEKETLQNRALLKGMIERFSRSIFHKQASYKGSIDQALTVQNSLGLVSAAKAAAASMPLTSLNTSLQVKQPNQVPRVEDISQLLLGGDADDDIVNVALRTVPSGSAIDKPQEKVRAPLHARVPAPLVMDFVSRPTLGQVAPIQRPPPSAGAQELQDRMRKKKGGDGKPERGVKISIEGRQLM